MCVRFNWKLAYYFRCLIFIQDLWAQNITFNRSFIWSFNVTRRMMKPKRVLTSIKNVVDGGGRLKAAVLAQQSLVPGLVWSPFLSHIAVLHSALHQHELAFPWKLRQLSPAEEQLWPMPCPALYAEPFPPSPASIAMQACPIVSNWNDEPWWCLIF